MWKRLTEKVLFAHMEVKGGLSEPGVRKAMVQPKTTIASDVSKEPSELTMFEKIKEFMPYTKNTKLCFLKILAN